MSTPPLPRRVRWSLAAGLLLLAPLCAEYLVGYDTSTGNPVALLGGLLILGPLYGGPALLIRELARRTGVRWPGILALAAAFGIVQAGVVDQSLFSLSYRQIDDWYATLAPTLVEPLGLSGHQAMSFLVGHVVWSFTIPIALMEAMHPPAARRPWLRPPGLVVVAVLYLGAAALILDEHLRTEVDHASAAQLTGALVAAALLVVAAFTLGRRALPLRTCDGAVPRPIVVGLVAMAAALGNTLVPATWAGVAFAATVLAAVAAAVVRLSRRESWDERHVVALATGALVSGAVVGFLAQPLGDVAPLAKYGHNTAFLVGSLTLGACALRRNRPRTAAASPAGASRPGRLRPVRVLGVTSGRVFLLRHGETEWSLSGRHTGRTDVPLTGHGRELATAAGGLLRALRGDAPPALVLTSPRSRARDTAALAGLDTDGVDERLAEWDYGAYEGRTTAEIRETVPGWTVWTHPCPGGETAHDVGERADAVLSAVRTTLDRGDVVLVGHGHFSRVLVTRWIGLSAVAGVGFAMEAGALSVLGHERGVPRIDHLNLTATA